MAKIKTRKDLVQHWNDEARKLLKGRTIKQVNFMTDADVAAFGWYSAGLIMQLDNGTQVIVQADPEGNGPGCLAICEDNEEGKTAFLGPL